MSAQDDKNIPTAGKNKRIAKNSLFIYMRMLIVLAVSLYTSRVVLEALGVTDFGIYNVVAGIVTLFSFFTGSLANGVQRFLNVGLARDEETPGKMTLTRTYFNQSMVIHMLFALGLLLIGETAGTWFVMNKLVIPPERLHAAFWAYQYALLYMVVNIIQIPYMAVIVSRERMSVYAVMGFVESFFKLGCVLLLLLAPQDIRLPLYSALVTISMLVYTVGYFLYCRRFPETRLKWVWDPSLLKEMGRFLGMTMFGGLAWSGGTQGVNILLNLFFGPAVNAARGIAMQIFGIVSHLTDSIYTAVKPQIIKSYTRGDTPYLYSLIFKSSAYAFIFMLVISIPIGMNAQSVLGLWLGEVPEYAAVFTQLVLVDLLFCALQNPMILTANATGNLRRTQIWGRLFVLSLLPLSWIGLKLIRQPILPFVLMIVLEFCFTLYCFYDIHCQIGMSYKNYFRKVISKICVVGIPTLLVCGIPVILMEPSFWRIVIVGLLDLLVAGILTYRFVAGAQERALLGGLFRKLLLSKRGASR